MFLLDTGMKTDQRGREGWGAAVAMDMDGYGELSHHFASELQREAMASWLAVPWRARERVNVSWGPGRFQKVARGTEASRPF